MAAEKERANFPKINSAWAISADRSTELPAPPPNSFSTLALAPNGKHLAAGSINNGTVLVWDRPGGKQPTALPLFKNAVRSLAWTPDSRVLAVRDTQGSVKLRDIAARKELAMLPPCHAWAIGPDSRCIALASGEQGQLRVHEIATGQVKVPLEGHAKRIASMAFSADGQLVASADIGGRVIVWEPGSRRRNRHEWQLPSAVLQVVLAPDNRHLITVNSNGSVYVLRFAPPPRPS